MELRAAFSAIIPLIAHAVVGIDNHLLIAGGLSSGGSVSTVQINTCLYNAVESGQEVGSWQSSVVSYPNPFSDYTTLEYELEHEVTVKLSIYNHLGQRVAVLVDGEQAAGKHQVQWNAEGLPTGIYYCQLSTVNCQLTTCGKLVKY